MAVSVERGDRSGVERSGLYLQAGCIRSVVYVWNDSGCCSWLIVDHRCNGFTGHLVAGRLVRSVRFFAGRAFTHRLLGAVTLLSDLVAIALVVVIRRRLRWRRFGAVPLTNGFVSLERFGRRLDNGRRRRWGLGWLRMRMRVRMRIWDLEVARIRVQTEAHEIGDK